MYDDNKSCILINNVSTDTLSPILFSSFINELAVGGENLNLRIDIGGKKLSILFYADNIVLMSESEENLQKIIDYCHKWCKKWMLKINEDKSNVVHIRKTRKHGTLFQFQCGN